MGTSAIAKGTASITINSQETEARLLFVPDPDGVGWDAAAVNKLASERQLGTHPDPKALEAFLAKAARAKNTDPMEIIFSQGIEPEEPVGEKINWEALHVPSDIASFEEETIAKAGPPQIIRTKVEKIKHEKKIVKTGALPFIAGKEEVEVSWEKKESQEKVDVNPKVLEVKYANQGKKIGTLIHATPGKPGKSIFGKPIPPSGAADSGYLLGHGIAKERDELIARDSGFLRIGENWADIIPFSKHVYNINTGIDGTTLFFNFKAGDARFTPPSASVILADAIEKGANAENLVSEKEIDEAIAEALATNSSIEAFALFHVQEAEARVDINHDQTRAVLFLRKGVAGALPLEMKTISHVIKESGIHGFDTEKLKTDIQTFMHGKDLVLSDYVLAEGVPSTRGKDREIVLWAQAIPDEDKKPIIARLMEWYKRTVIEEAEFAPSEEMDLAFVEKDAVVAGIGAGSEGEEGKDIFGNVIPGLPGNDPDIKLHKGLLIHGNDIIASQDGLLLLKASEKSFHAELIEYQDAKIGIHVSLDAMEATGDFFREKGAGIPLTMGNIKKNLAELEIKNGINWEALEKACAQARAQGSVLGHLIARGENPIAKGGPAVNWFIPMIQPETPEASGIDHEGPRTVLVKAGTPIVEISEPLPFGKAGYDVTGMEIPIENASIITIEHDESIQEVPIKGGNRLVAARSGELSFDGQLLKIDSIKNIEGDASGKIKFSGEIQINGNLLPGTTVFGGSHVTVDGLAEEALISAGGKAVVKKGFKGGGKGVLRAKAGIDSAFVERASVMAVGDIQLKKGSILSSIKTNGKLVVVAEGGKLSGGVCQARRGIDAADIGSEKGVRTEISFGQDYLIKDNIITCEENIDKIKTGISRIEKNIQDYLNKKLPLPSELTKEKVRLVKLLEQLNMKVFTLREKFEEHYESEIRIRGTVFPGVVIESHDRYYEVNQKRSRVVIYFDRDSGRMKERSLDGG